MNKVMKQILIVLFSLIINFSYAQKAIYNDRKISITTTFNINKATKDGYYLGDYVVNINSKEAQNLNGKTIKITGKYQIIKGLNSKSKKYNKGEQIFEQGRQNDVKYISSPKIEIIK